jgi:hypothetical protein
MQLNVIYSLITGRLVREKVDPAVQRVVRSQVSSSPAVVHHTCMVDAKLLSEISYCTFYFV